MDPDIGPGGVIKFPSFFLIFFLWSSWIGCFNQFDPNDFASTALDQMFPVAIWFVSTTSQPNRNITTCWVTAGAPFWPSSLRWTVRRRAWRACNPWCWLGHCQLPNEKFFFPLGGIFGFWYRWMTSPAVLQRGLRVSNGQKRICKSRNCVGWRSPFQ